MLKLATLHRIAHHVTLNSASHLVPLTIKETGNDDTGQSLPSKPLCVLPFTPWTPSSSGLHPYPSLTSTHRLSMARPCPHPLALFSLHPLEGNERAERIVSHSNNGHNVSTLSNGTLALDVGFHLHGKLSKTLATLGRGVDADIYVEGSDISRVQCSFEIDLHTGVVMLYDRSFANSTQVYGENATPFEHERGERKVLVQKDLNTIIAMGVERRHLVQFQLNWNQDATQTVEIIKDYGAQPCGGVENPRLARTVVGSPNPHTPGERQLKKRYV